VRLGIKDKGSYLLDISNIDYICSLAIDMVLQIGGGTLEVKVKWILKQSGMKV
jgi:hypothetical protein